MIKVFAFEPDAITDQLLSQCLEQFGFDQGRIIGAVPRNWGKKVVEIIRKADPTMQKQLDARVSRLCHERVIQILPSKFDGSSWIENATNTDRDLLDGIIVSKRVSAIDDRILESDDLCRTNSVWHVRTEDRIPRNAKDMAKRVSVLMRYADEVKFVDPYFSGERRHLDFIKECLLYRRDRSTNAKLNLEFHFVWKQRNPADDVEALRSRASSSFDSTVKFTKAAIEKLLSEGDSLRWCQWVERSGIEHQWFHDRYVLTNLGGVGFTGGLDRGKSGQKTSSHLLSRETLLELNSEFTPSSDVFELLHHEQVKHRHSTL